METSHRRVRRTLGPVAIAAVTTALVGCTSGTEAVPVPGADDVVTAPVASATLPPATEAATTAPPPETDAPSTTAAPASTAAPEAPTPTTSAPPPPPTAAAVPATDAPSDDVFLRLGDEGPDVAVMQLKLSVLDYLPAGSDTGIFDEATQRGLRRFQADYGLGVDGIFGPITGRSLNAAVQSVDIEG